MFKIFKKPLTISLILNIIFLSSIILWGAHYVKSKNNNWSVVSHQLTPNARHLLSRELQKMQKEISHQEKKEKRARKKLIKAMTAYEFKGKTYDEKMASFEKARESLSETRVAVYRMILSKLGSNDRERIAEYLIRHHEGVDQGLLSDLAGDIEASKDDARWNANQYVAPQPKNKPEIDVEILGE